MTIKYIFHNEINTKYKEELLYFKHIDYNYIFNEILNNTKHLIIDYIRHLTKFNYNFDNNITDYYIQLDIIKLHKNGCKFDNLDINDIYAENFDLICKDLNVVIHYN